MIQHGLKLSTRYTDSEASQEVQANIAAPCALTTATQHELQSICRWLLLLLGLEMPKRGQTSNQNWLLLVPGLEILSKRYRACLGQMLLI